MKTIEIQNCTGNRDNFFKAIVNGEKHIVRFQSKIQVLDDQPFEIRAKYFWDGSPKYTFKPKDKMILQVLVNQKLTNRFVIFFITAMILPHMIEFIYDNSAFMTFLRGIFLLCIVVYFFIRRKRCFFIREINKENTEK